MTTAPASILELEQYRCTCDNKLPFHLTNGILILADHPKPDSFQPKGEEDADVCCNHECGEHPRKQSSNPSEVEAKIEEIMNYGLTKYIKHKLYELVALARA